MAAPTDGSSSQARNEVEEYFVEEEANPAYVEATRAAYGRYVSEIRAVPTQVLWSVCGRYLLCL